MIRTKDVWTDTLLSVDQRFQNYAKKALEIGLQTLSELPEKEFSNWYNLLGNLRYKTLAVAGSPADTCIGGLCIVYTGDLTKLTSGYLPNGQKIENEEQLGKWLENLPRLDQIVESIGPTAASNYMVVYEDSFFAKLLADKLNMNQDVLQGMLKGVSERSSGIIERWITAAAQPSKVTSVYTSDIEDAIRDYMAILSMESGRTLDRDSNKVDLMYTYLWPRLLKELGYLESEEVLCSEPVQHFIETFNQLYGIQEFLTRNPWGNGKNNEFSVAGFLPSASMNGSGNSRLDTLDYSFTSRNRRFQIIKTVKDACSKPYPLSDNPLVKAAISYLYFSEKTRNNVEKLSILEKEYRKAKTDANGPICSIVSAQKTRNLYGSMAIELLEEIATEFDMLLNNLFG